MLVRNESGSVCLVCCVFDSVCELFHRWVDHVWSSKDMHVVPVIPVRI